MIGIKTQVSDFTVRYCKGLENYNKALLSNNSFSKKIKKLKKDLTKRY